MNKKQLSVSFLLIAMLVLSFGAVFPVARAQTTYVKVINPIDGTTDFHFDTAGYGVGTHFFANVTVFDVTELYSWQLNITWDPTMLDLLAMTLPPDHVFSGWSYYTAPPSPDINHTAGYAVWSVLSAAGQPSFNGTGTLVRLEFNITKVPDRKECLNSLIVIDRVGDFYSYLLDPDVNEIDFTEVNGDYQLCWAPPTTYPDLEVYPTLVTKGGAGPIVNTSDAFFDVEIRITDVDPEWHMVLVQFQVANWNANLIRCTGADEGPWMQSFWPTYWIFYDDSNYTSGEGLLTIAIVLQPNWSDITTWPQGSGVLCTLHFEVIYQLEFPWWDECPIDIIRMFNDPSEPFGLDEDVSPIPFSVPTNGSYKILGYILGRQLDLYSEYYVLDPELGGVGPNAPSDAFAPQDEICLYAKVTYNLDPVQHKLVTFEIRSPDNTSHIIILQNFTDTNGVAVVCFRLPWPCDDPETEIFGIWHAIATCSLAEVTINDTMAFRVGWLIEIVSIVPKQTEYLKGEHMEFAVTIRYITRQTRWAVLTIVVKDELNVPIGRIIIWGLSFGGVDLLGEDYFYANYTCIWVPKWAYIGEATIHANILTHLPWYGGYAYGPEATNTVRIVRP